MSLRAVLARAAVVLEGDWVPLKDALAEAESAMKAAGKSMDEVGKKMAARITLPLGAMGAASVASANSYEKSMKQIVALTEVSAEQVQAWSADVRKLAMEYGASARDAADALFFITSAGVTGAAAMETLKASLIGSAVGLGEIKTVADAATSAMNAYQKQGLSATRATEILAAGIKFGKFEAAALAPVLGSVVGTASALNIPFEDLVGTLAIFSRTGTDAAEGATQLSAIMSTLLGTTKEGEKALTAHGLSLAGLRKQVQGPHGLVEVMRTLDKAFAGNLDQLAVVIPNIRAFRGVMNVLAQDSTAVTGVLDGVAKSAGLLEYALAATKGEAYDTTKAWSALKDALLEIGLILAPVIVPVLKKAAGAAHDLAVAFNDLDTFGKVVVGTLIGLLAAAGPILIVFGSLAKIFAAIKLSSLIGGFGTLGMVMAAGSALVIGLGIVTAKWVEMKVAVEAAERATATARETMKNALMGTDPKEAERRIVNLTKRIGELKDQSDKLKMDARDSKNAHLLDPKQKDLSAGFLTTAQNIDFTIDNLERMKTTLMVVVKEATKLSTVVVKPPPVKTGTAPAAWAEDATKAMTELERELGKVTLLSTTLGAAFDKDQETARAYAAAIDKLSDAGVPLDYVLNKNGDTLRSLATRLGVVTGQITAAQAAEDSFAESLSIAARALDSSMTPMQQFRQVVDALTVAYNAGKISQDQFITGVTRAENTLYGVDSAIQQAMAAVQAAVTPQQQFQDIQQALNIALAEGAISLAQYNQALKYAEKSMADATTKAEVLKDGIENVTSRALDDLVSLAFGMKKTFQDFVMSALQDLTRLIVRMQVMRYLFPTAAGATSPLRGLIPGFADGGFLGGGKWGIVGERGPELVMAGRSGMTVTPGPAAGSGMDAGGGGGVALAFHVSANDQRGVAQFFEENEAYVTRAVTKAIQRSRALQRRLGA